MRNGNKGLAEPDAIECRGRRFASGRPKQQQDLPPPDGIGCETPNVKTRPDSCADESAKKKQHICTKVRSKNSIKA